LTGAGTAIEKSNAKTRRAQRKKEKGKRKKEKGKEEFLISSWRALSLLQSRTLPSFLFLILCVLRVFAPLR